MDNLVLTLVRLIIPISIFKWSLLGAIASFFVDLSDWHFYHFVTNADYAKYQVWDKVLDTYYLAIACYTSLWWKDAKARAISVSLFLYRAIGVALFIVFSKDVFLFFFPNIFENFFLFYLFYKKISKRNLLFGSKERGFLLVALIAIPKVIQEYLMHVLQINPPSLLHTKAPIIVDRYLPNVDWSFWVLFWLVIGFYGATLFWRMERERR